MLGQSTNGEFALGQIEDMGSVTSLAGLAAFGVHRTGWVRVEIELWARTTAGPRLQALTDVTIRDSYGMRVEIV